VDNLGQTGGARSKLASASHSVFGQDSRAHVQPKTFDCSGPPPVYLWIRSEQISTGWGCAPVWNLPTDRCLLWKRCCVL